MSWLVQGSVRHLDSLGSDQMIRPGQLNLMTAGHGIARSERSPEGAPAFLHRPVVGGPARGDRDGAAHFEHHANLPGAQVTVITGEVDGHRSPTRTYTPLMGAEVVLKVGTRVRLPLDEGFEHGVLPLDTPVRTRRVPGRGRFAALPGAGAPLGGLYTEEPAHLLVIGGEPFTEDLVMWWNLVGRDHNEVVRARAEWERNRGQATAQAVPLRGGRRGAAPPAPELPNTRMRPRP